jgi:NCAIR mutase (PurE)-related protein
MMDSMNAQTLQQIAENLIAGDLAPADFAAAVRKVMQLSGIADVGDAQVDLDRRRRCGFPEVIYSEGKTVEAISRIIDAQLAEGIDALATRMSAAQAAGLLAKYPAAAYNPIGRTFRIRGAGVSTAVSYDASVSPAANSDAGGTPAPHGRVTIVTAGTSDLPVAEEARETALWTGAEVRFVQDVGVAGPHRLAANLHLLADADAVVVVAGMEGALPSVVGGHVPCPVIAVPTSVGYGAAFGGLAALLGMLNSCASNVTVVNIDAGFKGGYVAGLIARNAAMARGSR